MTKIISALALLAVLAAATSSCSSSKEKTTVDTDTTVAIEEYAPVATDSIADTISTDSTNISE